MTPSVDKFHDLACYALLKVLQPGGLHAYRTVLPSLLWDEHNFGLPRRGWVEVVFTHFLQIGVV
jgi:hypothetical protein